MISPKRSTVFLSCFGEIVREVSSPSGQASNEISCPKMKARPKICLTSLRTSLNRCPKRRKNSTMIPLCKFIQFLKICLYGIFLNLLNLMNFLILCRNGCLPVHHSFPKTLHTLVCYARPLRSLSYLQFLSWVYLSI